MSRTAEGAALTRDHRRMQLAIEAATVRDLLAVWPLFRGDRESWERFMRAARVIVRARARDSAGIAAAYYRAFRTAEGIDGTAPAVRLPDPPSDDLLDRSFGATGLAGTYRALSVGKTAEAALAVGAVRMAAAGSRHVLNGGRNAVVNALRVDRRSTGWTRVASPDACEFCTMLASRGAVYKADTADFQAHDGDGCFAEPAF